VTHLIGPTSTKTDRAIRFGRELERAMKKRDVGRRPVAAAIGASDTSVMYWRTGRILPRIVTAQKLAEALEWPRLASLAIELRKKRCIVDDVEFVDDSGSDNRVYCSVSCQKVKGKRDVGIDRRTRAAIAEGRLKLHQDAVIAFCAACEPGGRCYAAECELRPVSPLPLFEDREPVNPVQSRGNGWIEAETRRAAAERAQTGIWARYSPEERQARIDRAAEASKRARGLVPA
jgi:DNA-binding XRE family transcriptional regulator